MLEAYKQDGDIKPLRDDDRRRSIGDNDRNEPVKDYDDESIVRLAEQMPSAAFPIATPVFDGAHEADIVEMLREGGPATSPASRRSMTGVPASRSTVR